MKKGVKRSGKKLRNIRGGGSVDCLRGVTWRGEGLKSGLKSVTWFMDNSLVERILTFFNIKNFLFA